MITPRSRRCGAALRSRPAIALLFQIDRGTPPRLSVVSGKTPTSTGVTESKPHSSDELRQPQSFVPRRVGQERRRLLADRDLHRAREVGAGRGRRPALRIAFEDLCPAFERATELVGPPVVERRQELVEELGVARRQLDAVVTGLPRPRGDVAVLARPARAPRRWSSRARAPAGTPASGTNAEPTARATGPGARTAYGWCQASIENRPPWPTWSQIAAPSACTASTIGVKRRTRSRVCTSVMPGDVRPSS